jgi:hypothetical protein
MELKIKIREVLRSVYGGFTTQLESEYENHIIENLAYGDLKNRSEWVTYNQVILELKHNIKNNLKVKELQYKLTDKTNPSKVCIEVLDGLAEKSQELDRLYNKIRNF